MKFRTMLSASLIAGAALFSVTACSSASPAPTPTETTVSVSSSEEVKNQAASMVTSSVNRYYHTVTEPETAALVAKVTETLAGRDINTLTDYERQDIAMMNHEAFRYFDTSTAENFNNAYNKLLADSKISVENKVEAVMVPMDAVTFAEEEGKATVDASKVTVVIGGEPKPLTDAPFSSPANINVIQSEYNEWLLLP